MGIREKLNENPGLGIALVVVIVLIVVLETYHYFVASPASATSGTTSPQVAYFTIDDGGSFFTDSATNVAPFDHNGKEAVKAYVFMVNGKKVVGYVEKHNGGPDGNLVVKKPGAGNKWIDAADPQAIAIKAVKGPNGEDLPPMQPASD